MPTTTSFHTPEGLVQNDKPVLPRLVQYKRKSDDTLAAIGLEHDDPEKGSSAPSVVTILWKDPRSALRLGNRGYAQGWEPYYGSVTVTSKR